MLILDVEVYSNYFLLSFKHTETLKVIHLEMYDGHPLNTRAVAGTMAKYTTVSFNGLSFDLPIITAALQGMDCQGLKVLSDAIIKSNRPSWAICRDNHIDVPASWDHIDLIEVAPGTASLKIYGGRLKAPKMQDLPIDPDDSITPDLRPLMRAYCENDLDTTHMLLDKLMPAIRLRESMSEQYGMDLRSKSDAQIAETVIKSELKKITGKTYRKPNVPDGKTFRYRDPEIVTFETPELQSVFEHILAHDFEVAGNGSIKLPDWLKATRLKIGDAEYQMGIGGLHSCEKSQLVRAGDGFLFELDVASYYPSIILQQRLAPDSMGAEFLKVYQSIVTRRLEAKRAGDKITADTLKICVNGSFGKLGSKYSALYAPELLLQTTITGQLALLMLIERMHAIGVEIVSANTDGVVCHCPRHLENDMEVAAWEWMLDTSYELERTDYSLIASRDVNNYVAVKPDGSAKGKGCFASGGLMKNPDRNIVYTAVAAYLAKGTPIADTIKGCDDIGQFVTVRRVKGGAVWRGQQLGKAVRFYSSDEISAAEHIEYALNGNKVPRSSGCRPLMDLPDTFPDDVDYAAYIEDAEKLLCEVGS